MGWLKTIFEVEYLCDKCEARWSDLPLVKILFTFTFSLCISS